MRQGLKGEEGGSSAARRPRRWRAELVVGDDRPLGLVEVLGEDDVVRQPAGPAADTFGVPFPCLSSLKERSMSSVSA
jgi:hypothetical protein